MLNIEATTIQQLNVTLYSVYYRRSKLWLRLQPDHHTLCKTSLIAYDRKSNFLTQTQSHMSALLISVSLSLSATAGCFSLALWQSQSGVFMCHRQLVVSCVCLSSFMVLDKEGPVLYIFHHIRVF